MKKIVLSVIIAVLLGLCLNCQAQERHYKITKHYSVITGDTVTFYENSDTIIPERIYQQRIKYRPDAIRSIIDEMFDQVYAKIDSLKQPQEQLTYDQLYQLVSNQFKNSSQKFNHLFNRIDSLEKRVKELELNCLVIKIDSIPFYYGYNGDTGGLIYQKRERVEPFKKADSVFYQNATIKSMEKPDTIWPGLWRPKKQNPKQF